MDDTVRTKAYTVDIDAYFRTFWMRWYWIRIPILLAIYGLFSVAVGLSAGAPYGWSVFVPLLILTVLIVALRYGFLRKGLNTPFSRRILSDPRVMEFSGEALHTTTEGGIDSRIPWIYVLKAHRRGSFMFVYTSPLMYFAVPDITTAWKPSSARKGC